MTKLVKNKIGLGSHNNSSPVLKGWGKRHSQCLILFFSITIAYSIRSCMGVALVAMTDHTLISNEVFNASDEIFKFNNTKTSSTISDDGISTAILRILMLAKPFPTFHWSKTIQDTVLSSFFWGYMLLQIPAGMLSHRFGTRFLLFSMMISSSVTFIILPWAAYYGGWVLVLICRFVQGMGQACIMPSLSTFFGKWAPLHERGRMTALVYGGQSLGAVVGIPLTGFIASSGMGWPGIFRFYGLVCALVGGLMWRFLADTPADHPSISAVERMFIEAEMGQRKKDLPIPWVKILRHRGVWGAVIAHIAQAWGQVIIYTQVPAYLDKVMGVNIKANGVLSALPFLGMWLANFVYSIISDWLITNNILSVVHTRKLANSFGCILAGCGFIAMCYVPKNLVVVETVLVLTCTFKMATHLGFHVVNIDIAPNFAGTLMSISNFAANGVASFAPILSGFILTDATNVYLWRQVFYITAASYFLSNLIFVIIGTADLAEWNDPPVEKDTEEGENHPMIVTPEKP